MFVVHMLFFGVVFVAPGSADQLFTSCANRKGGLTSVLQRMLAYSAVECAAACTGKAECRSASFQRDENECVMFADSYNHVVCESLEYDANSHVVYKEEATTQDEQTTATTKEATTQDEQTTATVNPCKNNQPFNGANCVCESPLTGLFCENGPRDCANNGGANWVDIYPDDGLGKIRVWCWDIYMLIASITDQGWTTPYRNKTWNAYRYTFGDIDNSGNAIGGYWLGNENVHRITNTNNRRYKLKYVFNMPPQVAGFYHDVFVDRQANNYTLYYGSYQTSQNVDQVIVNGSMFRTINHNDNGCAATHGYGFWYNGGCNDAHTLNGIAYHNGLPESFDNLWIEIIRE